LKIDDLCLPEVIYNKELKVVEDLVIERGKERKECCYGELMEVNIVGDSNKYLDRIMKNTDKDEAFRIGNEMY